MKRRRWKWRIEGAILGLAVGLLLGRWAPGEPMGQVMEEGLAPFSIEETKETKETETKEIPRETDRIADVPETEPMETAAQVLASGAEVTALMNRYFIVPEGVDNVSEILPENTKLLLTEPIDRTENGPQILIYHTHSQEAFADSEPGNVEHTVVGLGNRLAERLSEMGFRVYHDLGVYDLAEDGLLERSRSYDRALPKLQELLKKYPSIQIAIDVHRDGVAEDIHLVTEIEGKQTARIMFVNGLSEEEPEGNPFLEENLALSLQLIQSCKNSFPEFTRSIYIKSGSYNQNLCRSLLLEVGAQTNTVAEARNAIDIFAEILGKTLFGS